MYEKRKKSVILSASNTVQKDKEGKDLMFKSKKNQLN